MKIPKAQRRALQVAIVGGISLLLIGKLYIDDHSGLSFLWAYGGLVTFALWSTFLIAYLRYRDPSETADSGVGSSDSVPLFVSCMVAVRNEEAHIGRCLDSMLDQTYRFKEVIVVNDASTDGTREVLQQYADRGVIALINLEANVGKKAALAEAMKVARGDIFAHTDSDSLWAVDAIERIVRVFEADPEVGAVSGHGRASNAQTNILTLTQDAWMEGQFSIRKAFESTFGAVTCVSGPLAVFRRSAVFNYLPAWTEDRFLGQEFKFATDRTLTGIVLASKATRQRLLRKYQRSDFPFDKQIAADHNWKVLYCKSARSWTIVPDSFPRFMKQQIRWKKSFIRNTFFTGAFFWRKPFPVAASYYAHILFVLMGPWVSFRHLVYLPMAGNITAAAFYLGGIAFVGLMFGIACKLEDEPTSHWIYRPLMSLMSTLILSWLLFYSAATIKKMTWHRG